MKAMAPVRPSQLRQCCFPLPATPAAAARARKQVSDAIAAWGTDADREAAVLLTSELVTNAVLHDSGGTIVLTVSCCCQLRVDVHDASRAMPVPAKCAPIDSESGRGLLLVESIADQRGCYPTSEGKVVCFTLALPPTLTPARDGSE